MIIGPRELLLLSILVELDLDHGPSALEISGQWSFRSIVTCASSCPTSGSFIKGTSLRVPSGIAMLEIHKYDEQEDDGKESDAGDDGESSDHSGDERVCWLARTKQRCDKGGGLINGH